MRKIILASMALFIGVLAGGVLVGRATAQQPPPAYMPAARFQYQCMTKWNDRYWSPELAAQLNGMGAQGFRWMGELRHEENKDVYCFERRL